MFHKQIIMLAPAVCFLFGPVPLMGDEYSLADTDLSGGGGSSAGGSYAVTGAIVAPVADPLRGGNYRVEGHVASVSLEITKPPSADSFTEWIESLPSQYRPPEELRDPSDEPGGDGMSNLLKYYLGLMPMIPSREAAPEVTTVPVVENGLEHDFLAVEFERSASASVAVTLEGSQNLASWDSIPFTTEVLAGSGDGREKVRLVTDIPVGAEPAVFLRMALEKP